MEGVKASEAERSEANQATTRKVVKFLGTGDRRAMCLMLDDGTRVVLDRDAMKLIAEFRNGGD